MRHMSFMLTTEQIRARTKTVTRRIGWQFLKPGDLIRAIEKGQGLKKGETVKRLGVLRVVSVRREPLARMLADFDYGALEVQREGFADHPAVMGSPHAFAEYFMCAQPAKTRPDVNTPITRIEFEYVEAAS